MDVIRRNILVVGAKIAQIKCLWANKGAQMQSSHLKNEKLTKNKKDLTEL